MKRLSLYFVPQADNNYRARILQPSFLAIFIALYFLNQSLLQSITILRPGILGFSSEITVDKVLLQTNQERQTVNLPPLQFDSALSQSAKDKAEDMFQDNYWAHNSPSGTSPWEFIKDSGYQYSIAGENLAKDFYDTPALIKAWMRSPTHRDNIVHQKYKETGIAVVDGVLGGVKTTLVVQHFGTPILATSDTTPTAEEQRLNSLAPVATAQVLSDSSSAPVLNPRSLSKILSTIMFIVIITTLVIDGYLTLKNKTKRLAGSATGHISFLFIIFMLMLFTQQGSIL